jgi:hypothetical protein
VITIDSLIKNIDVDISFLKIDAEGAEPEVLSGIGEVSVDKVGVDCSAERDGCSPEEKIEKILLENEYEVKSPPDTHIVFGRKKH